MSNLATQSRYVSALLCAAKDALPQVSGQESINLENAIKAFGECSSVLTVSFVHVDPDNEHNMSDEEKREVLNQYFHECGFHDEQWDLLEEVTKRVLSLRKQFR